MVWPTLKSRTAKEQNRTEQVTMQTTLRRAQLTLLNLHLTLGVAERREQVQFESRLGTQTCLEMSVLVFHRLQSRQQHFGLRL